MSRDRINDVTGKGMMLLSLVALLTVITGYFQAPQVDEGAGAHIFQIAIVLLAPVLMVFLLTADFRRMWRPLLVSAMLVGLAFAALYYLEHYFYVERAAEAAVK